MGAVFVKGNLEMIDHIPVTDVAAGTIVQVGGLACVALRKLEANRLGALAKSGQFDVDTALSGTAAGTKVDHAAGSAVADGGGTALGVTVATPANSKVRVAINQVSGH